jgi:hypothetical protein
VVPRSFWRIFLYPSSSVFSRISAGGNLGKIIWQVAFSGKDRRIKWFAGNRKKSLDKVHAENNYLLGNDAGTCIRKLADILFLNYNWAINLVGRPARPTVEDKNCFLLIFNALAVG